MSRVLFSAILAFGLLSIVPMGISAKVIAKVGGYPITLKRQPVCKEGDKRVSYL